MRSSDIIDRLRLAHPVPRWAFFEELRCGTGFGGGYRLTPDGKRVMSDTEQRIDAWAMDTWASREAVAFEVKVSRSDWLRELKKPEKREAAMRRSERFYFAAPAGLVRPEEIPEGCGLVEVGDRLRWTVRAPKRQRAEFDREFVAMILRRQYRFDREEIRQAERAILDEGLSRYGCLHRTEGGKTCRELRPRQVPMWCLPCAAKHRLNGRAS